MSVTSLNGSILEKMLKSGLKNIQKHEKEINDMNVFPVPDGDTGSNMRMTLQNGIFSAESTKDLGTYLKLVKKGMLLGARGNSGVILSQIFAGMSKSLERDSIVNIREFIDALECAYQTAYKSVINPVEGTILTVAREGFEYVKNYSKINSFEELFQVYISKMRRTLLWTPELLPVLKESGVLDSGAAGYIYIFEGLYKGLCNEEIEFDNENIISQPNLSIVPLKNDKFTADSKFEDGYCTEFLLQLLNDENYNHHFDLKDFIEHLEKMGDSLVVLQDEDRVKVHIHTKKPSPIISFAQNFGEFVTFKMENMQLQHNQHIFDMNEITKKVIRKPFWVIAVVNGEGISNLYKNLGCDVVIEGGPTMNTSTQEFLTEFKKANADTIIVLPNNKNIFQAAKQAAELSELKNIHILNSKNIAEGYYALAMGNADTTDADFKIKSMQNGIESVDVLSVTVASKNYSTNNIACQKGDFIALLNGNLVENSQNFGDLIKNSLEKVSNLNEKESCVIFTGINSTEQMNNEISKQIEKNYPEIEITFVPGGQEIFNYVIGF